MTDDASTIILYKPTTIGYLICASVMVLIFPCFPMMSALSSFQRWYYFYFIIQLTARLLAVFFACQLFCVACLFMEFRGLCKFMASFLKLTHLKPKP